jgi:hypothetical protein
VTRPKALLSWSSGKDAAWALQVLRQAVAEGFEGMAFTFADLVPA